MVNQQLAVYVAEQLRVGVSKDAIKTALLDAGWVVAEVNEALGISTAAPRMDAIRPVAAKTAPQTLQPTAIRQGKPIVAAFGGTRPMNAAAAAQTTAAVKPQAMPVAISGIGPTAAMKPRRSRHRFIDIVMGLLILALGAAGASLFVKNSGLAKELGIAVNDKEAAAVQIETLRSQNNALQSEAAALREENAALEGELRIFVSDKLSGAETVEVAGVLGGGIGAAPYTLRTANGVLLTVKNSAAAASLLKPLLGAAVSIIGTHDVASPRDIFAQKINGVEVSGAGSSSGAGR